MMPPRVRIARKARLLALSCVLLLITAVVTTALATRSTQKYGAALAPCCFIAVAGVQQPEKHEQHQEESKGGVSSREASPPPVARRLFMRRTLAKPKQRTDSSGDVGNLVRLEVAQRMKEMKLMTQPGLSPLAPTGDATAAAAAAARLVETTLPSCKVDGDGAALEHQICLLSARITSIADHLKATPTDAVSRKGLVVLVKRRRRLLQTLRHRDQGRWLATTETLGLRQRTAAPGQTNTTAGGTARAAASDGTAAAANSRWGDARRERRRDRGRRRRRDAKLMRRRR